MKKILLVEDDYLDVISVKRALSKLNVEHTLHVAHNGVDALAMLMGSAVIDTATPEEKVQPDIIILDLNMPKMNGLEFLEIIKKYYSLKNIKVFVMTTSSEEYDKAAARRLGITGYILKPLDFGNPGNDESGRSVADLKQELESHNHMICADPLSILKIKRFLYKGILDYLMPFKMPPVVAVARHHVPA